MATTASARITLRYEVHANDWALPEEPVPESQPHDLAVDLLKAILLHWVARTARSAQVARNLAVRWDEQRPKTGVDPDLCVIEPRTPEGDDLSSLCTWREGHATPALAIEVVSESNAAKDYVTTPERYAACGVPELWVFDPKLAGPTTRGGPYRLQIWTRAADGAFERVHAGEGPAWSPYLRAWLFAVDEGRKLRVADDREGTRWWPTGEEAERAEKEAERAEKEAERAEKEAERAEKEAERAAKETALAKIAELEAKLASRS